MLATKHTISKQEFVTIRESSKNKYALSDMYKIPETIAHKNVVTCTELSNIAHYTKINETFRAVHHLLAIGYRTAVAKKHMADLELIATSSEI